MYAREGTR